MSDTDKNAEKNKGKQNLSSLALAHEQNAYALLAAVAA